ncbi:MAG: hypothetical protein K0R07_1004 [Sedimentibacter sp.]|jgi:hypothetical protein|nr:hypothetical protein [Sedimentibacter sp.]
MAKKLVMIFKNAEGKSSTLTVEEPKAGLTDAEVRTVMDAIIAQNVFNTNGGDLVTVKSAEIISTTEEILI